MAIIVNEKLSILMAKHFIKISTLAKETGISRSTLTNMYYSKSKMISFSVLDKLCRYFNCDVSDILEYREN